MRVAYRMAICDDISEALDTAENMARDWANLRGFELEIDRFSSAPDFFADYENGRYDILLLDIEMGAVNGVELAASVKKAADFIEKTIAYTAALGIPPTDGICIEQYLWELGKGNEI